MIGEGKVPYTDHFFVVRRHRKCATISIFMRM
jgi:hypothetical protein